MKTISCEKCLADTDPISDHPGWGWCSGCQHGTHAVCYADVASEYHTDHYATHNGEFQALKKQWTTNVDLLKTHIRGREVLDVGFLEGSGMAAMTDAGFDVIGFDVSTQALDRAKVNGIPEERLIVSSELVPELLNRKFDAVTCREVIEHVPDPGKMLSVMTGLLNPGGIAQIQTPLFDRTVVAWACGVHLRVYSVGSLVVQAESAGLLFVEVLRWQGGMCCTFRKP